MTNEVENLMLEHLERFQATLDDVRNRLDELTVWQTETHSAVLGFCRDQVGDAEAVSHVQVQLDRVRTRLERIERRLEL